jgi:hypothetical protein
LTFSAKAHKLLVGLTPKKGSLVELKIMFEKWKQEEGKKIQEGMLLRGARRLLRVR